MKRLLARGKSGCPSRSLVGRIPALPVLCNNVLPGHRVSSPICQSLLLLPHACSLNFKQAQGESRVVQTF
uniref:Uncharacterized protein n=1 Tax=Zea mays TaxID=4577 RepID=B6SHW2_MAIZE|nr:hypothetical protein [Zea mays]ACG25952.1 hypothetical protein [Zea mays]